MKRTIKTIRGARGSQGAAGLSAYGLWLKEGHVGTVDDFFHAIGGAREVLFMHHGGQLVGSGDAVSLQKVAGKLQAATYVAQMMLCADGGIFSLFVDGYEQPHTRYRAQGMVHGLCVVRIQAGSRLELRNVSEGRVALMGEENCIDGMLWLRPID